MSGPQAPLSTEQVYCYVAADPGKPGFYAAAVDRPEYKKDTAKDVAGWVRRGATVSRVTVEQAREGMAQYLKHKRDQEAQQKVML